MRREICGECGSPISDGGACDCTELLKRGWRQCAVGQKTTQWCAMAETLLREHRQRDEALLRQALEALELRCGTNADERKELIPALRERLG